MQAGWKKSERLTYCLYLENKTNGIVILGLLMCFLGWSARATRVSNKPVSYKDKNVCEYLRLKESRFLGFEKNDAFSSS